MVDNNDEQILTAKTRIASLERDEYLPLMTPIDLPECLMYVMAFDHEKIKTGSLAQEEGRYMLHETLLSRKPPKLGEETYTSLGMWTPWMKAMQAELKKYWNECSHLRVGISL